MFILKNKVHINGRSKLPTTPPPPPRTWNLYLLSLETKFVSCGSLKICFVVLKLISLSFIRSIRSLSNITVIIVGSFDRPFI